MDENLIHWLGLCSNNLDDRPTLLAAADWCMDNNMDELAAVLKFFGSPHHHWLLFTGSRKYGVPKPDSDFDWVVYPIPPLAAKLENYWRQVKCSQYPEGEGRLDRSLKVGPLNLLMVSKLPQYKIWQDGTAELYSIRPVTRDTAIRTFERLTEAADLGDWFY